MVTFFLRRYHLWELAGKIQGVEKECIGNECVKKLIVSPRSVEIY